MSDISDAKKTLGVREKVIAKLWDHLHSHFDNYSPANQIKIILAICAKNIPQLVDGNITYTSMQTIKVEHKPLKLDLGEDIPEDLQARRN